MKDTQKTKQSTLATCAKSRTRESSSTELPDVLNAYKQASPETSPPSLAASQVLTALVHTVMCHSTSPC